MWKSIRRYVGYALFIALAYYFVSDQMALWQERAIDYGYEWGYDDGVDDGTMQCPKPFVWL